MCNGSDEDSLTRFCIARLSRRVRVGSSLPPRCPPALRVHERNRGAWVPDPFKLGAPGAIKQAHSLQCLERLDCVVHCETKVMESTAGARQGTIAALWSRPASKPSTPATATRPGSRAGLDAGHNADVEGNWFETDAMSEMPAGCREEERGEAALIVLPEATPQQLRQARCPGWGGGVLAGQGARLPRRHSALRGLASVSLNSKQPPPKPAYSSPAPRVGSGPAVAQARVCWRPAFPCPRRTSPNLHAGLHPRRQASVGRPRGGTGRQRRQAAANGGRCRPAPPAACRLPGHGRLALGPSSDPRRGAGRQRRLGRARQPDLPQNMDRRRRSARPVPTAAHGGRPTHAVFGFAGEPGKGGACLRGVGCRKDTG